MRPLSTLDRRTVLKAMSLAPFAVLSSGLAARAAGLLDWLWKKA